MSERPGSTAGGSWERIYAVVRRIPAGRVATYGQVAALAGLPGQARLVGYALSGAAGHGTLPWHRVINAQGRVSTRSDGPGGTVVQRLHLEAEGVRFGAGGRVSLEQYRWRPEGEPESDSEDVPETRPARAVGPAARRPRRR